VRVEGVGGGVLPLLPARKERKVEGEEGEEKKGVKKGVFV